MRPVPVIIGQTYGLLTVLEYPIRRGGFLCAEVVCRCGKRTLAKACNLARGRQKSCGCLMKVGGYAALRHDMSRSSEYKTWSAAKKRCCNPNDPRYRLYGGRGIKMCDEWASDFAAFYRDMGRRPGKGYTLERLDSDGDYEPVNCVWATYRTQNRNLSRNIYITRNGQRYVLGDLALAVGLTRNTVYGRRRQYKWPESRWLEPFTVEQAIEALERRGLANVDQVISNDLIPVDSPDPAKLVKIDEPLPGKA